jgi:hypothetical protein
VTLLHLIYVVLHSAWESRLTFPGCMGFQLFAKGLFDMNHIRIIPAHIDAYLFQKSHSMIN